ncbi:hypothetical protein ACFQE1_11525 [Halobium palmae]|uniref:Uncharacterized protein n=1 Tax=Halobium palmae TaxID=1776492 RepID=A0ABD5RZX9_9EURY
MTKPIWEWGTDGRRAARRSIRWVGNGALWWATIVPLLLLGYLKLALAMPAIAFRTWEKLLTDGPQGAVDEVIRWVKWALLDSMP